jgi:hypothetical protein
LRQDLREAVAVFEPENLDSPILSERQDDLPTKRPRPHWFLELLQNGDVSDDERIIMEDELFKRGFLQELPFDQ